MTERAAVAARLNAVFQDTFDDPSIRIHDGMTAADIDDWDSLQHIVLVLAVEREFEVRLNPAEVGKLENVGKMLDLLLAKTAPRLSGS
jgi:acyl carrier protein